MYGVSLCYHILYCVLLFNLFLRYLVQNLNWLEEQLEGGEDDYFLFDCPGDFSIFNRKWMDRQVNGWMDG